MSHKKLKTAAVILFCFLLTSPLLGTILISAGSDAEAKQYNSVQFVVMFVYALPFIVASLLGILLSNFFSKRNHAKAPTIYLAVSIVASLSGSLLMLTW